MSQNPSAGLGSLDEYIELVTQLISRGYDPCGFENFDSASAQIILRHDIDINLGSALDMAQAEASREIASTYFVMLSSDFYNPISKYGRRILREIVDCGHHVGLHFEPHLTVPDRVIDRHVEWECEVLEELIGRRVGVVAPHRPSRTCPEWLGRPEGVAGRLHAYQPPFFEKALYLSDSSGFWLRGSPLEAVLAAPKRSVQLLTHPHLWRQGGGGRNCEIKRSLREWSSHLQLQAEENFTGFQYDGED